VFFTYWTVVAAPSQWNAPVRSARSTSRQVSRSICRLAPNTSGSTSVAKIPELSAVTAAANSPASACNCAAFAANSASIMCSIFAHVVLPDKPISSAIPALSTGEALAGPPARVSS
jgi:hypothetical protein